MKNSFCKEEKLCNKILIDQLFDKKKKIKFTEFPLTLIAQESPNPNQAYPAQVMISVSRRKIRLAVTRNLIKRRIREAYRLNKFEFYKSLKAQKRTLIFSFIYLGNKPIPYEVIEEKIIVLLNRLTDKSD